MTYDADFLAKLRRRDPATSTQFVFAFTPILEVKLRYMLRDHGMIEDVINETFYRVLIQIDKDGIRDPAQFGSFVRGVSENVAHELIRKSRGTISWPEGYEPACTTKPIEELLSDRELRALLRKEIGKLTADEEKLVTDYLQGKDRQYLARERGITRSGYNVKLHRALQHLIREFRKNQI
jgi:RNA polymerase sigma factor (sigma-70 family)